MPPLDPGMQQDPTFAVSSVLVTSSPSTKTECIVLCKGTGCHAGKLSGEVGTRQKSNENKHNTFGESMLSGLTGGKKTRIGRKTECGYLEVVFKTCHQCLVFKKPEAVEWLRWTS